MTNQIFTVFSKWFSRVESQTTAKKAAIGSIYDNMDKIAKVAETIHPGQRGRVSFQATTWFAVCPYDIVLMPNTPVRVIGDRDSTILIVEPILFGTNSALPSITEA